MPKNEKLTKILKTILTCILIQIKNHQDDELFVFLRNQMLFYLITFFIWSSISLVLKRKNQLTIFC